MKKSFLSPSLIIPGFFLLSLIAAFVFIEIYKPLLFGLNVAIGKESVTLNIKGNEVNLKDVFGKIRPNSVEDYELRGTLKYFKFYNISDISIADAIENLKYDDPIANKLREYIQDVRESPLNSKEIGKKVEVSSPGNITGSHAAVCETSPYIGKSILIMQLDQTNPVKVLADESFPCPWVDGRVSALYNLIQISPDFEKALFPNQPIQTKRPAIALIVPQAIHPIYKH